LHFRFVDPVFVATMFKKKQTEIEKQQKALQEAAKAAAERLVAAPPPMPGDPKITTVVVAARESSNAIALPAEKAFLVRAWYGVATDPWGANGADVTAAAGDALARGEPLVASNKLFGDPSPKMPKVLLVAFKITTLEAASAALESEHRLLPMATVCLPAEYPNRAAAEEDDSALSENVDVAISPITKDQGDELCTICFTSKKFPHRVKKCPRLALKKGAKVAAVVVGTVGVLALTAVGGAVIATGVAEKKHAKEKDELLDGHGKEKEKLSDDHTKEKVELWKEHSKVTAELQNNLEEETALRVLAETTLEETERALTDLEANMQAYIAELSEAELEIEALIKQTKAVRPSFDVVFVLDISGSMTGKASAEMFSAVCRVLATLHPNDVVSIILFNHTVDEFVPLTPKRTLDFPNCVAGELGMYERNRFAFRCSGGTALWDAIVSAMSNLKTTSTNHPHLVVLTDGADGSRLHSRETVEAKLHERLSSNGNFHSSFITVGNPESSYVRDLERLASTHNNLHHFNAKDAGEIENTFYKVSETIQCIIKLCLTLIVV
jgi:Mg-chelatase subunit ChlD